MSSFAWAIDLSTFPEDTKKHLTEWCERTAVRSGLDEGRLFFVRKKKEKRTALYHNIRNLTRKWGVNLPEGSDWLHEVDLVKAEEDNATPNSPEVARKKRPQRPTRANRIRLMCTSRCYRQTTVRWFEQCCAQKWLHKANGKGLPLPCHAYRRRDQDLTTLC